MPKVRQLPDNYKPITETYKQLEGGQIFKNYKELCIFLNQPISTGASKKSQLEQFRLYFEYETIGHKIIINEVYEMPLFNYSNGAYQSLVQKLVLDKMAYEVSRGNHRILVSSGQLMEQFHMVNKRYRQYKSERQLLKSNLDISIGYINDFYFMTDNKLIKIIESTLNSLRRGSYIHYNKVMAICEDKRVSVADPFIREIIIKHERNVFDEMGLKDYTDAMYKNKVKEFREEVLIRINDELRYQFMNEEYNLDYYYTAYDIVMGERVKDEKDKLDRYILDNKIEVLKALNDLIVSKHKEGYSNRYDKSYDNLIGDSLSVKDSYRINGNYVDNGNRLIDYTIKHRYGNDIVKDDKIEVSGDSQVVGSDDIGNDIDIEDIFNEMFGY